MPPREVEILPQARAELKALAPREAQALFRAIAKLAVRGEELGYPHTSAVQTVSAPLRELRPRQGDSPVRALYGRIGSRLVVAAIGPEAQADPRGFARAVQAALTRLAAVES
jgi:hypothetical protein